MIVALAFAACTATPTAPPPTPDPPPDHRKIIADNLKTLFSPDAQVRNVMVSELMQVPSSAGQVWGHLRAGQRHRIVGAADVAAHLRVHIPAQRGRRAPARGGQRLRRRQVRAAGALIVPTDCKP
jgi:hypothetical protein